MRDIEQMIREVDSSMAMEGMPLTKRNKEDMRSYLRGETTYEEIKERILADARRKKGEYERI